MRVTLPHFLTHTKLQSVRDLNEAYLPTPIRTVGLRGRCVCHRFAFGGGAADVQAGSGELRAAPRAAHAPRADCLAAKWKYALDVQGEQMEDDIVVERQAMPAKWDWPLASPLKLRANGVAIDWNPAPEAPRLPSGPIAKREPSERITLIPFGCTKFRVSMLPITERVLNLSELKKSPQPAGQ
jgi:hypothetical protein